MIERDYIMRMINQLTRALARILMLKKEHQYAEALKEINTSGRTLLGVDLGMMHMFSDTQLLQLFGKDDTLEIPKCYILGLLLKEDAELLHLQGNEEQSLTTAMKSLSLLTETYIRHAEPVEPGHIGHVDSVIEYLAGAGLPVELREKVFRFYAATGRYDKAEDCLFDLLELSPSLRQEGIQFYTLLLEKADEELERGNLPRDEVVQGLADLQVRYPNI